ncbi:MAG TPA: SCO family protein [Oligoflexia bacterium]|nr:SCO family protein [Oligoflexia bacterium]HMR24565.1 SCO family protein [Oligoflexia bacterium]
MLRFFLILIFSLSNYFASCSLLFAQEIKDSVTELENVQIQEKLGQSIDLNLAFVDQDGQKVLLKDVFSKDKPTILSLVYYECPMLCTLVLNGITEVLGKLKFKPGKDFDLVSVSIDADETPDLAKTKQTLYLQEAEIKNAQAWPFLVGSETNIKALADSVGFNFEYDKSIDEFAHPAVFFIISPSGKVSRYFYGVQHKPANLQLALTEASEGKVGSAFDKFLLYCYRYDPDSKGYVLMAWRVMRISALISVIAIALLLLGLKRREKI